MEKTSADPPGEFDRPAEREASESSLVGDWGIDGGSDWRKDEGDEGGAMNGTTEAVEGGCVFGAVG